MDEREMVVSDIELRCR